MAAGAPEKTEAPTNTEAEKAGCNSRYGKYGLFVCIDGKLINYDGTCFVRILVLGHAGYQSYYLPVGCLGTCAIEIYRQIAQHDFTKSPLFIKATALKMPSWRAPVVHALGWV